MKKNVSIKYMPQTVKIFTLRKGGKKDKQVNEHKSVHKCHIKS